MSQTGTVFNIQRFSVHDGPGIRTTVFLKGCPLRCDWCHNPEGIDPEPHIATFRDRCIDCGSCREICDEKNCISCGKCVSACPSGARKRIGERITVDEVMKIVRKDRIYFDESGGGVTFSGGEPLYQPEFLLEILENCRREDIHTTVETSGFAPWTVLEAIHPLVDLFLYDIKSMDDEVHRGRTGRSNELILDNLRKLGGIHRDIVVRMPIIPDVNDSPGQRNAAVHFARSVEGVRNIEELPYHELGRHKETVGKRRPGQARNPG